MSIKVSGLANAKAVIRGSAKEVQRARINATNGMASRERIGFVKEMNQATGVKKNRARKAMRVRRANIRRDFSILQSSGRRILGKHWPKAKIIPVDATRARVLIAYALDGKYYPVWLFYNPAGARWGYMARWGNTLDIGGQGLSVVRGYTQYVQKHEDKFPARFEDLFFNRLDKQIAKRK